MQATLMMLAALTTAAPLTLSYSVKKPTTRAAEPAATAQQSTVQQETAAEQAPIQTPDTQSTNPDGEKWRFRQHDGLWWYWLPSEKWVYWHEGKWVPYDASTYAELQRSQPARQSTYYRGGGNQSTSGYPELGQWGRVRYDGYGQRQYPYSRRNSGIRQLGPVPAMGGVRSLPGWGGER